MKLTYIIITLIGFVSHSLVCAQNINNQTQIDFVAVSDTIVIDSSGIVPQSLVLYFENQLVKNTNLYEILYFKGKIIVLDESMKNKKFTAKYRKLFFNPTKKYFHKDYSLVTKPLSERNFFSPSSEANKKSQFLSKTTSLQKSGNISRGISFGNNSDVVVNSTLNLQLAGKLNDKISILAAISDQNIPMQPDGNSQQIQDFDKVYIKLFSKQMSLVAGDYSLSSPAGNFMVLNKTVQGAKYEFNPKGEKVSFKTVLNGSISKGKYTRQVLQTQEGVLGPYKLYGSEGEIYIIIVAGSERVFLNGRQLKRGEDADYVMDYNLGEISFTPYRPITKDHRLTIEFEYSERNFTRFSFASFSEMTTKKSRFWFNFYHESDAKNQPLQQDLSDENKRLLSEIGDSLSWAVAPNIDSVGFDENRVLYKKMDTTFLVGNERITDTIYIYSTNADSAIYKVGFSETPPNSGSYIQKVSVANGRVFEWKTPINGIRQGNYKPVRVLITPKKKQLLTAGGEIKLKKNTKLAFEFAFSDNDINTFSDSHSADNQGYALSFSLDNRFLFKDTLRYLKTNTYFQFIHKNFSAIENYRSIEFERDWNITKTQPSNELMSGISLSWIGNKNWNAGYNFDFYRKEQIYDGLKNAINFKADGKYVEFKAIASIVLSSDSLKSANFIRHNATLKHKNRLLNIGFREEAENNIQNNNVTDSLLTSSYDFSEYELFIENPDSSKVEFRGSYKWRDNRLPKNNSFCSATYSKDIGGKFRLRFGKGHTFAGAINYRRLQISDTTLTTAKEENNLTSGIEHNIAILRQSIRISTRYETGTGLEVKREFSFIEVPAGQGVYKWEDYNENGVQELGEFEPANFVDEAKYIRVFLPTDNFQKVYTNEFSSKITLRPAAVWRTKKGLRKFASRFSNRLAYRAKKKTLSVDYNPISVPDNAVSINTSARNILSFDQNNARFGIDYIFIQSESKTLLLGGSETVSQVKHNLNLRYATNSSLHFGLSGEFSKKGYASDLFDGKNYNIEGYNAKTDNKYQISGLSFFSLSYSFDEKRNVVGTERNTAHKLTAKFRQGFKKQGSAEAKFNFVYSSFNADVNTPIAYAMLDGFLPGNNFTWELILRKNLGANLQLDLNYLGRKTGNNDIIHTGGLSLRAIF